MERYRPVKNIRSKLMVKSREVLLCPVFSFSFSMASSGSAKYSRISPCRIFGACKNSLIAPEEGRAGEKKEERASTKTGIPFLSEASSITTVSVSSFTLCSSKFCSLFLSCSSCKAFSKAAILASSACSLSCLCRFFSAFFSAFFAKLFSFLANASSPSGFSPFFFPITP